MSQPSIMSGKSTISDLEWQVLVTDAGALYESASTLAAGDGATAEPAGRTFASKSKRLMGSIMSFATLYVAVPVGTSNLCVAAAICKLFLLLTRAAQADATWCCSESSRSDQHVTASNLPDAGGSAAVAGLAVRLPAARAAPFLAQTQAHSQSQQNTAQAVKHMVMNVKDRM